MSINRGKESKIGIAYQFIRQECELLVVEAIVSEIKLFSDILRNQKILQKRIDDLAKQFKQTKQTRLLDHQKQLKALLEKHNQAVDKIVNEKGDEYRNWVKENTQLIDNLCGTKYFDEPVDISASSVGFSEKTLELIEKVFSGIIQRYAATFPWETIYEKYLEVSSRLEDQITVFLSSARYRVIEDLLQVDNLQEFKQRIKSKRAKLKKSIKQLETSKSTEIQQKSFENYAKTSPTLIDENWDEFLLTLASLSCKSEMQFLLKKYLISYIEKQKNKPLADDQSKQIRGQIQYLISCLLQASTEKRDEGILFSPKPQHFTIAASPQDLIGLNYILQQSSNQGTEETTTLIQGLKQILSQYENGQMMFLKPVKGHPLTFTDLVEARSADKSGPTPSELSQLYWKYFFKQADNSESASKINQLNLAIYYQARAILAGNKKLLKRIVSKPKKILAYEIEKITKEELLANLQEMTPDSATSQSLFYLYGQRSTIIMYQDPAARLQEILQAFAFIVKDNDKRLSAQDFKSAVTLFIEELIGRNPFARLLQKDKSISTEINNCPFRLISKSRLNTLFETIFLKNPALVTTILNEIDSYVDKHIRKVSAQHLKENKYTLEISAEELINSPTKMICFMDPVTNNEIGRFVLENGKVKFIGYGDDISLKINGSLNVSSFILENPEASVDLSAELESENLYFAANVKASTFHGSIKTSATLYCESQGSLRIDHASILKSNRIVLKPSSLNLEGKISATDHCNIDVDDTLEIDHLGVCEAKSGLQISANALKDIRGRISSNIISIKTNDSINLRGAARIHGYNSIELQARTIFSSKKATVTGAKSLKVVTEGNVTLEDESVWKSAAFLLKANSFTNYTPNTLFGKAVFHLKDKLVNHENGIINTDLAMQINAQSVFNNGTINYGELLNAAVNEFFVNGLSQFSDIYSTSKIRKHSIRPSINGGNASIVAGVYINLLSTLKTGKLSVSSIALLNLASLTVKTGGSTSALINVDLGVDLPNLPAIFKDIKEYFAAIADGNYQKALDMTLTSDVFYKASSLLRWLLRMFTTLGKPVDLVWALLSTIATSPQLIDQCINLYNQEEEIQTHQIVALLNTINSVANQAVMLDGQIGSFAGFGSIGLQSQAMSSSLALDVLALVLPYSSNNSLVKFQAGFHVGFTEINRNAFNFSTHDVNVAINKTDMFYLSNQQDQLQIANSIATIGNSAEHSGVTLASIVYSNVDNERDAGVVYADQVTYQNKDLELSESNAIHANHVDIQAQKAFLNNQIQLSDKNDSALTVHATVAATTGNDSHITAAGSVDFVCEGNVTENGTLSAQSHSVHAGHNIDSNGTITSGKVAFEALHDINMKGKIDTHSKPTSAADVPSPSFTASAGDSISTAFGSETKSENGEIKFSAGHDFTSQGSLDADTLKEQSGDNTTVLGDVTVNHGQLAAHDNMLLNGAINVKQDDAKLNDNTLGLAIFSRNLQIGANAQLNAEHTSILAESQNNAVFAGNIDANKLQVHAGNDLLNSAHLKINQGELKAEADIQMTAKTELTGADSPILIVEGHTAQFTASSETSGAGTIAVKAESGEVLNFDVDNVSIDFAHVPQVEDLLQSLGVYQTIHAHRNVAFTTTDDLNIDRPMDLSIGVSGTANSVNLNKNIHSTGSLVFTATGGSIHIAEVKVAADAGLSFNSHGDFVGDKSTLVGYEVAIQALRDVVNNGGHWAASDYLSIVNGGDVKINCLSKNVQGKYDTMKSYQPGYLIGGAGKEHGGVGLFIQTDGKFIILGSSVISQGSNVIEAKKGCDLEALYQLYISYYRHYHNWTGRTSDTTDYSYQLQPAVIYSQNGSNSLISSDGAIYSVSTQFYAAQESNIDAKGNVSLLGYVLENREIKERDNFYVFHKKTDQKDEFAVPTVVVSPGNITVTSHDGNIEQHNAFLQTNGTLKETARSIHIDAPILNSSFVEETSGLTFSTPALDMTNAQPLGQDYQSMTKARNGVEWAAAISNILIDSLNFANSILAGINSGSVLQGVFQASNLIAAEVGYSHTKTSSHTQTAASNVGVCAGDIELNASEEVTLGNGVNIEAVYNISIEADSLNITGAECHNSYQTGTQSIAVGMSLQCDPTVNASASGTTAQTTEYENTHVEAGGDVSIHVRTMNVENGDIDADTIEVEAQTINIETKTGESSSHSWSANASTSGNCGFQNSETQSRTINEVSGLHAKSHLGIEAKSLHLVGATITSEGTGTLHVDSIVAESVHEEKNSNSFGLSGGLSDFGVTPKPDFHQGITTATVSIGQQDYSATQQATIYFAKGGTDLGDAKVTGDLNTKNASGYSVQKDEKTNVNIRIPTSSVAAGFQQFKDNFAGAKQAIFGANAQTNKDIAAQLPAHGDMDDGFSKDNQDTQEIFTDSVAADLQTEAKQQQSESKPQQSEDKAEHENTALTDDISNVVISTPDVMSALPSLYSKPSPDKSGTKAATEADEDPEVFQADPESLQSYVPPLSNTYSDITTLPDDQLVNADLKVDDVYDATTENGMQTGYVSGAQRFENNFNEKNSFQVGPQFETTTAQSSPQSYLDEMANSRVVNALLGSRQAVVNFLNPVLIYTDVIKPLAILGDAVATMDVVPTDSPEFQESAAIMEQFGNALKTAAVPALNFASDIITLGTADPGSEEYKDSTSRMNDRLNKFKSEDIATQAYQITTFGLGLVPVIGVIGDVGRASEAVEAGKVLEDRPEIPAPTAKVGEDQALNETKSAAADNLLGDSMSSSLTSKIGIFGDSSTSLERKIFPLSEVKSSGEGPIEVFDESIPNEPEHVGGVPWLTQEMRDLGVQCPLELVRPPLETRFPKTIEEAIAAFDNQFGDGEKAAEMQKLGQVGDLTKIYIPEDRKEALTEIYYLFSDKISPSSVTSFEFFANTDAFRLNETAKEFLAMFKDMPKTPAELAAFAAGLPKDKNEAIKASELLFKRFEFSSSASSYGFFEEKASIHQFFSQEDIIHLTDFGLESSQIREFHRGELVPIEIKGIASEPIEAFIKQENNMLSVGILWMKNEKPGINVIDLFTEKSKALAMDLKADKLELFGMHVDNPYVRRYLRMKGFEPGAPMEYKNALDEVADTMRKMFDIKLELELTKSPDPTKPKP